MCKKSDILTETREQLFKLCYDCAEYDDGEACPEPCEDLMDIVSSNKYIVRDDYANAIHSQIWEAE